MPLSTDQKAAGTFPSSESQDLHTHGDRRLETRGVTLQLPRLTASLSPVTIAEKGPGEGTLGVQTIRAAWSHARGRMMAVNAVVLLRAGPVSILLR